MRKAFIPYGLIGLAVLLLAQGCGTVEFSRKPDQGTASTGGARSVAPIPKSEALAQYSMALIAQRKGRPPGDADTSDSSKLAATNGTA